jgi:Transposase IS4
MKRISLLIFIFSLAWYPKQPSAPVGGDHGRNGGGSTLCRSCTWPQHFGINCEKAAEVRNQTDRCAASSSSSSSGSSAHQQPSSDGEGSDDDDDVNNPVGGGELDPNMEDDEDLDNGAGEEPQNAEPAAKRARKCDVEKAAKQAVQDAWKPVEPQPRPQKRVVDTWMPVNPIPKSKAKDQATARAIPDGTTTPIAFFKLFFTAAVIANIVICTNLYGAWKDGDSWKPVSDNTIYHFVSILIYMGVKWQPEMDSYWMHTAEHADIFGSEWVRERMGRDRFYSIWTSLHFIDVTNLSAAQRVQSSKADGFYLVRPFLVAIKWACQQYCLAGRGLSIDEISIATLDGPRPVWFTGWNDNKPVYMLSTFPVWKGTVNRKVKEEDKGVKKGVVAFHEVELDFPTSIEVYNRLMGGTDAGDQKASYYRYEHQTKKWPHRIFSHFINLCMVNAFILFRWTVDPKIKLLEFTVLVMKALAAEGQVGEVKLVGKEGQPAPKPVHVAPPANKVMYNKTLVADDGTTADRLSSKGGHYPVEGCGRRLCPCCSKQSSTQCGVCGIPLHCAGREHENCFWRWHNMTDPRKDINN